MGLRLNGFPPCKARRGGEGDPTGTSSAGSWLVLRAVLPGACGPCRTGEPRARGKPLATLKYDLSKMGGYRRADRYCDEIGDYRIRTYDAERLYCDFRQAENGGEQAQRIFDAL